MHRTRTQLLVRLNVSATGRHSRQKCHSDVVGRGKGGVWCEWEGGARAGLVASNHNLLCGITIL